MHYKQFFIFLSRISLPFCLVTAFFFANGSSLAFAFEELNLTKGEVEWMTAHPVIRVAPDPDFPPIEFIDGTGHIDGISYEYLKRIEVMLPIKFKIVGLKNWDEVLEYGKSRKIDMFSAAVPTPDRLQYMVFTRPYIQFPAVVLVKDSAENFPTLSELTGKRVAVVSNYADHEYMLRAYPNVPLEVMPSISDGLRQVSFGKVDAMVLNLASASFYIQKDGISNLKVTEDTDFVFDLSFANRNDWPELTSILEKAMLAIPPEEKKLILDKWISLGKDNWQPSPLFLLSLFAALLVLSMLITLYWNRMLTKQVRDRTADLKAELTERLEIERENAKLERQVYRSKKMEALGLLAGGVAHDLNNILVGVVGYSDLALRMASDKTQLQTYIKEIHESGIRAAVVVEDLLTISRDSATARNVVNVNSLIKQYLNSPEHQALMKRFPEVTFLESLDTNLHNISCSEVHLKKSIMNLTMNAAEAALSGKVIINTSNKETVQASGIPGKFVVISVKDEGPGVSPDDIEHIFEPFYSKKKLGHSGSGLGLAVVWNTVQELQGFIEVKQPGKGTQFDLYIPASEKKIDNSINKMDEKALIGNGETILVIDDEESVRILACALLSDLGYKATAVSSGEEAVTYLKNNSANLLLIDMIMDPGMNGYQTYEKIKKFLPNQKALIASGFSESKDVQQALDLGAGAYLKKPYTRQGLGLFIYKELKK